MDFTFNTMSFNDSDLDLEFLDFSNNGNSFNNLSNFSFTEIADVAENKIFSPTKLNKEKEELEMLMKATTTGSSNGEAEQYFGGAEQYFGGADQYFEGADQQNSINYRKADQQNFVNITETVPNYYPISIIEEMTENTSFYTSDSEKVKQIAQELETSLARFSEENTQQNYIRQTVNFKNSENSEDFSDLMEFISEDSEPNRIEKPAETVIDLISNQITFKTFNVTDESGNIIELQISHELPSYQQPAATTTIPAIQCDECFKTFTQKRYLKQHKIEKHNDGLHCKVCNRKFMTAEKLENHEKMHDDNNKRFPCSDCHLKFASNQSLQRHYSSVHNPDSLKYQCQFCSHRAYRKDHITKHERTHNKVKKNIKKSKK